MKKSRILCLLLALLMVLSIAACNNSNDNKNPDGDKPNTDNNDPNKDPDKDPDEDPDKDPDTPADEPYKDLDWAALDAMYKDSPETGHYDASDVIYDAAFGDFYDLYSEARKLVDDNSERWVALAKAEAKLLESGVLSLQTCNSGGMYTMNSSIPRSLTSADWGLDSNRMGKARYADRLLTPAERTELTDLWKASATADDYYAAIDKWIADKGYSLRTEVTFGKTGEAPKTWDVLNTYQAADSEYIAQGVACLLQYDNKDTYQPCLAESYKVSDDGLVYTFTLREGLIWVDQQGRKVADLTADDFVAGMQHAMDSNALGYLFSVDGGCGILNADDYMNQVITDFSQVGVKALDDRTVQYTLTNKAPYFLTMLGYGCFAPMNRAYYESKGGKFGVAQFDPSAADYTYGTSPENILYCGEHIITSFTDQASIVYEANPTYWDADNVVLKKITYQWVDSTDVMAGYNNTIAGTFPGCALNTNSVQQAKTDLVPGTDKSYFDTYAYVSGTDMTAMTGFYNLNRRAFANCNDETRLVSKVTAEDSARTRSALNNQHFRLALCYGVDRGAMNAAGVGEDLKLNTLINTYTPGNLVSLEHDVTTDINGTSTTFKAGTYYGEIVQAQITADGYPMKVWDATMNEGVGSSGGFDGWYNVDNAKAEMEIAIKELGEAGIKISKENPIKIEYPFYQGYAPYANKAAAYEQSVEATFGGMVDIVLNGSDAIADWYYCGYYTDDGSQANYDMYDFSGWGPDYRDPATYLDTFLPDGVGSMTKCVGLY